MHKRPRSVVSPSGLRPILAVSQNAFRPGDPRNGPESRFCCRDPTIIWEKGNLGAPGSAGASLLLGEQTKVEPPFRPPGAPKTAETDRFRPSAGKNESTAATYQKYELFLLILWNVVVVFYNTTHSASFYPHLRTTTG